MTARIAHVVNDTGYDDIQEENIPQGELALHSGMEVQASDGKVGKLVVRPQRTQ